MKSLKTLHFLINDAKKITKHVLQFFSLNDVHRPLPELMRVHADVNLGHQFHLAGMMMLVLLRLCDGQTMMLVGRTDGAKGILPTHSYNLSLGVFLVASLARGGYFAETERKRERELLSRLSLSSGLTYCQQNYFRLVLNCLHHND